MPQRTNLTHYAHQTTCTRHGSGYGNGGGFEFSIQNKKVADIRQFFQVSEEFLQHLNARPEVEQAYSGYDVNFPQHAVEVDASRCKKMGVSPATILDGEGNATDLKYLDDMRHSLWMGIGVTF